MLNKKFAYMFEARGIQRYLFATGKLKDMLNGSELIDYICADNGMLDKVLYQLGFQEKKDGILNNSTDFCLPRKAGGAFYLIFKNDANAKRFIRLWRILMSRYFPTLETVDAFVEGQTIKDVVAQGIRLLAQNRNKKNTWLPSTSPITERYNRTGLAVSESVYTGGSVLERVDTSTACLRWFKRPKDNESPSVTDKFVCSENKNIRFPNNFENTKNESYKFPLKNNLVGLIHADGNGLGLVLRVINKVCESANDKDYLKLYRMFSEGMTRATIEATQEASKNVLIPDTKDDSDTYVLPARPLVLGGDDLSVIVRADLAVAFTQAFLTSFEEKSRNELTQLHLEIKRLAKEANNNHNNDYLNELPQSLTACAGIVFMKSSQPFHQGYDLAEGLCKKAKIYSKNISKSENSKIVQSSLAFYQVKDSSFIDVEQLITSNLTAVHNQKKYLLSQTVYLVGKNNSQPDTEDVNNKQGYPSIEKLLKVAECLKLSELNQNFWRDFNTSMKTDINRAKRDYRRWKEFSKNQPIKVKTIHEKHVNDGVQEFHLALTKLIGTLENDLPITALNMHRHNQNHDFDYLCIMEDVWTVLKVLED